MAWKPAIRIVPDDVWQNLAVPKSWEAPYSEFVIATDFGWIWVPPEVAETVVYDAAVMIDPKRSREAEKWIQDRIDDLCVSIERRGPLNHGPEMPEASKRVFFPDVYGSEPA